MWLFTSVENVCVCVCVLVLKMCVCVFFSYNEACDLSVAWLKWFSSSVKNVVFFQCVKCGWMIIACSCEP